jgi:hypothetical protein
MIILALALAATPAVPPALSPRQEEEIVVLGRKLQTWRGSSRFTRGRHHCRTKTSSGDPKVDRIACDAMTQCMGQLQPKVDAIGAGRPKKAERKLLMRSVYAELGQCLKQVHDAGLRRLAAQEEASKTE